MSLALAVAASTSVAQGPNGDYSAVHVPSGMSFPIFAGDFYRLDEEAPPLPFLTEPGYFFEAEDASGDPAQPRAVTSLYVYRRAWWFIKFRMTRPGNTGTSWERLNELVSELEWPELNDVAPVGISIGELMAGETPIDFCQRVGP